LLQNGEQQGSERMGKKINESEAQLRTKVLALEETGCTALGPAVATAIAMAS